MIPTTHRLGSGRLLGLFLAHCWMLLVVIDVGFTDDLLQKTFFSKFTIKHTFTFPRGLRPLHPRTAKNNSTRFRNLRCLVRSAHSNSFGAKSTARFLFVCFAIFRSFRKKIVMENVADDFNSAAKGHWLWETKLEKRLGESETDICFCVQVFTGNQVIGLIRVDKPCRLREMFEDCRNATELRLCGHCREYTNIRSQKAHTRA